MPRGLVALFALLEALFVVGLGILVPFVVGLIHEATGGWSLVIVLLALTSVPLTLAGLRVARPSYVDDEI